MFNLNRRKWEERRREGLNDNLNRWYRKKRSKGGNKEKRRRDGRVGKRKGLEGGSKQENMRQNVKHDLE